MPDDEGRKQRMIPLDLETTYVNHVRLYDAHDVYCGQVRVEIELIEISPSVAVIAYSTELLNATGEPTTGFQIPPEIVWQPGMTQMNPGAVAPEGLTWRSAGDVGLPPEERGGQPRGDLWVAGPPPPPHQEDEDQ